MLIKVQQQILKLVAEAYPQVYLVGGTALRLLYDHRISEDLDFFTQKYSSSLHRQIAAYVKRKTGFKYHLVEEDKRKKYLPMAVYEFQAGKGLILKVDFVKDVAELFRPRDKNGIADIEDLYYRRWRLSDGKRVSLRRGKHWPVDGRKPRIFLIFIIYPHTQNS